MEHCLENSMEHQTEGPSMDDLSVNKLGTDNYEVPHKAVPYHSSDDASLFSSSLPVLPHAKLNLSDAEHFGYSVDDELTSLRKVDCNDGLKDAAIEPDEIGIMLPNDEEELLAGIMDDFDLRGLPNQVEDLEECDLFGSGGGLEMDFDSQESIDGSILKPGLSDGISLNGVSHFGISNGMGTVAGEHPYGEHPSRTLFVRNINSNVEDSELRTLFEQYGDIRALYTACKHRGFVMISYYDIRAARTAMRTLQNKPLRRRKLDIHFSIPKDNPSEKDINQGTLVVFNLDASVTNDDLRCIFGAYGEVKEIRETPHKRHHKFIEFYDVRSAEAALKALNRSDIAGKRIKLEPSRPGGARRNLIQHMSQELDQDEIRNIHHHIGSPITNSPPGNWPRFDSPTDHSPLQTYNQSRGLRPVNETNLPGLGSILPPYLPSPGKISPIGKDQGHDNNFHHGYHMISSSPKSVTAFSESNSSHGTLNGPQFLWGSPSYSDSRTHTVPPNGSTHAIPFPGRHTSPFTPPHHVASAPVNRHSGYFPDSPETLFTNPAAFGSVGLLHNGNYLMNMRMAPLARHGPSFLGNHVYQNTSFMESLSSGRRQVEDKNQYHLDLEKIVSGEDTRTTLMIKNIPNKYTSKMLLATMVENHKGTFDFLYLPIDFKNKCNVGYAFINMVSPACIIPFYEAFNGKKWEKFNSEKVASLAYARIQGKAALVTHFQNSSLMNEDKGCRPIVFPSDGDELSDGELKSKLFLDKK